jgi:hypothetical protein
VWILLIAAVAADTLRGKYSTLIDKMLLNVVKNTMVWEYY